MQTKKIALVLIAIVLFLVPACTRPNANNAPLPPEVPASPTEQPSPVPSETPAVEEPVVLHAQESETQNDALTMEIYLYQPVLEQPEDKASGFNQAVENLVQEQVNSFTGLVEENLADQESLSELGGCNSLYLEYLPTNTEHGLVSIKFTISTYNIGAAHPFSYSSTLNYNLETERILQLEELFLPESDYLGVLSEQSILIISEDGYMDWPEGAAPEPDNYRNWNITPEGILISFDPYQVAAYAAGPQQALVPYAVLESMIDREGPLDVLLP